MKKKLNSISDGLIQLEISKIREKYEKEGFNVYQDTKKFGLILDLFAINKITSEKIVFEVKSVNLKKDDIKEIIKRCEIVKEKMPGAKFYVVVAREPQRPKIEFSYLNQLLLDYIENNKSILKEVDRMFPKRTKFGKNEITDIVFTSINLNEIEKIELSGYGTYKFYYKAVSKGLMGMTMNDGIPFEFELKIAPNLHLPTKYEIVGKCVINFDYSEFKRID